MGKSTDKILARHKRRKRVRKKIFGTRDRPRLSLHKSNRYIYAQLIDDTEGKTLVFASSTKSSKTKSSKRKGSSAKSLKVAEDLGKRLAGELKKKGIKQLVFDRNGYPYHGRIKIIAEVLRSQGIIF